MSRKFEATIIEHGDGVNKHLFFIAEVTNPCRYIDEGNHYRELVDSGMRHGDIDDCHEAIAAFIIDVAPRATVTTTLIHS